MIARQNLVQLMLVLGPVSWTDADEIRVASSQERHPSNDAVSAISVSVAKWAAERLGVVPDTIWEWCQSKRSRHRKIGRMIRIDPRDLENFEQKRTVEPR